MNFIKSNCPKCGAKMYINCDAEINICAACDSVVLTKDVVKDSNIHASVPNTKNELDDLYERFHTISIQYLDARKSHDYSRINDLDNMRKELFADIMKKDPTSEACKKADVMTRFIDDNAFYRSLDEINRGCYKIENKSYLFVKELKQYFPEQYEILKITVNERESNIYKQTFTKGSLALKLHGVEENSFYEADYAELLKQDDLDEEWIYYAFKNRYYLNEPHKATKNYCTLFSILPLNEQEEFERDFNKRITDLSILRWHVLKGEYRKAYNTLKDMQDEYPYAKYFMERYFKADLFGVKCYAINDIKYVYDIAKNAKFNLDENGKLKHKYSASIHQEPRKDINMLFSNLKGSKCCPNTYDHKTKTGGNSKSMFAYYWYNLDLG